MTSRLDSRRYRVFTTEQFEDLWQDAVDLGVIAAEVGPHQLEQLIYFLSNDPYYFAPMETVGEPVDMRRVNFMPDANPSVEIWYSLVEDDRAVFLISVELIYPAQPSLPGFDF
jgi:hypothetical protein